MEYLQRYGDLVAVATLAVNASPELFDFDAWRANYDSMTYQDHLDVYSELWKLYPVQRHFDAEACDLFLSAIGRTSVVEVGGWDGELAARMLVKHPIDLWANFEICADATAHTICGDSRYWPLLTAHHFLGQDEAPDPSCETLVMSHSAEHMRWAEFQRILTMPSLRAIYLASPLPEDGSAPDWNHYPGTHILEVGWDTIGAFLGGLGFRQMEAPRTHEVRAWAKP